MALKLEVLIDKGSAAFSCDTNRTKYVEQLNMNVIKIGLQ